MTDSPRGLPVKEAIPLKSIRKKMAQAMKTSVETAALSQISREIDVTPLKAWRQSHEPRYSLNTLIMAVVARTLPAHPLLNAELVERNILVYATVNLGMAVASPAGLVVVVIPNAQQLAVAELSAAVQERVERTHAGTLTMADVEGGTFTVSNLGMYGVDGGFPLPRPPEGAILLVGAARPKPAVVDGQITVRDLAWFSLTYDHRFIDGVTAAVFLQDLNNRIASAESGLE